MLTRKKSTGPRTKRPRRQRYKFLTPDLVLRAGQKVRFVASTDNPLNKAERLREEYAEIEVGQDAELSQFLQRTCEVAARFRRRPVRDWVLKFNAHGPDGLIDRKPPGQPPRLNDAHRAALAAVIESGPIPAVHGVIRWRIVDLCQWIWEEFRVVVASRL
jgi:hypothetical protein